MNGAHLMFLSLAMALAAALAMSAAMGEADARHATDGALSTQKNTAGSDQVYHRSKLYMYLREKCKVHTELAVMPVLHNGHRRNNPDRTFYPGDALGYHTNMRVEGCSAVKVCPVEVPGGSGECTPLKVKCSYSRRGGCQPSGFEGYGGSGPRSEEGSVVLPHDIYGPDESYRVAKKAHVMAKVIVMLGGYLYTGYQAFVSESAFPVRVIDPGLSVSLSYEPLTDSAGHTAANLDGTYYVWDPISVIHEIDYAWKEERLGTIYATHTKDHGMLELAQELDCDEPSCVLVAGGIAGYDAQAIEHSYAGGSAMYNSSCAVGTAHGAAEPACARYHGRHGIDYTATLHNIHAHARVRTGEARAHDVTESIEPLIVRYDPQFGEPYAYVSLADSVLAHGDWAWSKRHVMAVRYDGSLGGGRDDADAGPHEMRRALLNEMDHEGTARYLTGSIPLDASLSWNATAGPSARDAERCTKHDGGLIDGALLLGRHAASAMFTQAAYGRLYMEYPISEFMAESGADVASLRNTVRTEDFAGHELRDLVSYNYTYPRARFAVPASLAMVDGSGPVADGGASVEIVPTAGVGAFGATVGPSYLHDRICESVELEADDAEIANMVVSDMYPRKMAAESTGGGRVDYILNRTGVSFTDVYALMADSVAELGSNTIYEAPSAYEFSYGVTDGTAVHSRNMTAEVLFTTPILEIANVATDNAMDYAVSCPSCAHTTLQARPREAFGDIASVERNGVPVERVCSSVHGCTVSAVQGIANTVMLTNVWGGTASATVSVGLPDATDGLDVDVDTALLAFIVAVAALVAWRIAHRLARMISVS